MLCEEMQLLMDDKIDGSISTEKEKILDLHLAECEDCRQEYFQLKALVNYLIETPIEEVPPDFMDNVMAAVKIPLHYRIRDNLRKWLPTFVLHPILAITALAMVFISWVCYYVLFDKLFSLLSLKLLYKPLLQSPALKQIAYIIRDVVGFLFGIFQLDNLAPDFVRNIFTISATMYSILSYLLTVTIIVLFIWATILFSLMRARRMANVQTKS